MRHIGLILFGLLASSPLLDAARADMVLDTREATVLAEFSRLTAVAPNGSGEVAVLGKISGAIDKAGLVFISDDGTKRAGPILTPNGARSIAPHDLIRLSDGDLVVVGAVTLKRGGNVQGWAARLKADGKLVWSRLYGAREIDIFYFAKELGAGMLLLGGRTQKGSRARDWAKGTAYVVDAANGAVKQQASTAQGYLRAAFYDAAVLPGGEIVFAGWATKDDGQPHDDIWLVKARSERNAIAFGKHWSWGEAGDDIAFSIDTVAGALLVTAISRASPRDAARGLVFKFDLDLMPLDRRYLPRGKNQSASLRFATSVPGAEAILVTGAMQTQRGKSSKGWAMVIDRALGCSGALVHESAALSYVAGGAVADDGRLILVGTAKRGSGKSEQGAVVRIDPSAGAASIGPGRERVHVVDVEKGASRTVTFGLAKKAHVEISVSVLAGDADAFLLGEDGGLLAASTNRGRASELLAASLGPGTYRLQLNGSAARSRLAASISVRRAKPAADAAAKAFERNWTPQRRLRFTAALKALGYTPGQHPEIGVTPRTRRAVAAYQASLCEPPTGWLSEWQGLRLGATAARMAHGKAAMQAARARDAAATAEPVERGTMVFRGATLETGTVGIATSKDGPEYHGEWSSTNFTPQGYGVWINEKRRWSGNFRNGLLDGSAVFEVEGPDRYILAGGFTANEEKRNWSLDGYGVGISANGSFNGGLWGNDDKGRTTIKKPVIY